MFDEEQALNWVVVLHALGYQAYIEESWTSAPAIWCEDAGLMFRAGIEVKGWLARRWAADFKQEVLEIG